MTKLTFITAAALAAFALVTIGPATAQSITRIPKLPNKSTYSCHNEMGYLRRVHVEEIDQVEDATQVWITPVCVGEDGLIRNEGNASALRTHIAANEAMMSALFSKAFGPDDVVGVRMTGEDTAILYVHPFHH